jgi:hypothetical protein
MSDSSILNEDTKVAVTAQGTMFLYQKPEYLNKKTHDGLGWTLPQNPYDFAKDVMSIPLVLSEIPSAQKFYPIIFSALDDGQPLAVFSVGKGSNLFVDSNGMWASDYYIPAYLRRYPFATVAGEGDKVAVVIDRASNGILENSELPFFEGEHLSQSTQSMVDLSVRYEADRKNTQEFMRAITSLGLLKEQHLAQPADGENIPLTNFISIDGSKVDGLSQNDLEHLNKNGFLALIYAQLFSQENWGRLIVRMTIAEGGSSASSVS